MDNFVKLIDFLLPIVTVWLGLFIIALDCCCRGREEIH